MHVLQVSADSELQRPTHNCARYAQPIRAHVTQTCAGIRVLQVAAGSEQELPES
jgi:hypothetical protein